MTKWGLIETWSSIDGQKTDSPGFDIYRPLHGSCSLGKTYPVVIHSPPAPGYQDHLLRLENMKGEPRCYSSGLTWYSSPDILISTKKYPDVLANHQVLFFVCLGN